MMIVRSKVWLLMPIISHIQVNQAAKQRRSQFKKKNVRIMIGYWILQKKKNDWIPIRIALTSFYKSIEYHEII